MSFTEQQRFRQWWLWLLMLGMVALASFAVIKQLILDQPFGENPMPNAGVVLFALFLFGIVVMLVSARLITEIDEQTIRVRFFPFFKREVPWSQVREATVVDHGFVGGWGIRYTLNYGQVYTVKGRQGLMVITRHEEKFTIGTQRPDELRQLLLNFRSS